MTKGANNDRPNMHSITHGQSEFDTDSPSTYDTTRVLAPMRFPKRKHRPRRPSREEVGIGHHATTQCTVTEPFRFWGGSTKRTRRQASVGQGTRVTV